MKKAYEIVSLLVLLCCPGMLKASEPPPSVTPAGHAIIARCGVAVPLSEMGDRAGIYLPAVTLAYRYTADAGDLPPVCLELEAGFFAYRAERKIAGDRASIYTETVMLHAMPAFRLWGDLWFYPSFGTGIIFNIVRQSSSPGTYAHVGCAAGVELGYRISRSFSVHLRTRALLGLDRDRVFYHLVPEIGGVYHF